MLETFSSSLSICGLGLVIVNGAQVAGHQGTSAWASQMLQSQVSWQIVFCKPQDIQDSELLCRLPKTPWSPEPIISEIPGTNRGRRLTCSGSECCPVPFLHSCAPSWYRFGARAACHDRALCHSAAANAAQDTMRRQRKFFCASIRNFLCGDGLSKKSTSVGRLVPSVASLCHTPVLRGVLSDGPPKPSPKNPPSCVHSLHLCWRNPSDFASWQTSFPSNPFYIAWQFLTRFFCQTVVIWAPVAPWIW